VGQGKRGGGGGGGVRERRWPCAEAAVVWSRAKSVAAWLCAEAVVVWLRAESAAAWLRAEAVVVWSCAESVAAWLCATKAVEGSHWDVMAVVVRDEKRSRRGGLGTVARRGVWVGGVPEGVASRAVGP